MSKRFPATTAPVASSSSAAERREYLRLNSVLPIEFQLFEGATRVWLSGMLQGYTQDVGEGGLCVDMFRASDEQLRWFRDHDVRVQLTVHLPPFRQTITVVGRVAWLESDDGQAGRRCRFGVAFERIDAGDRARLLRYAQRVHWLPKVAMASLMMLTATAGSLFWQVRSTGQAQHVLASQVHELAARERIVKQQLAAVERERSRLTEQLRAVAERAVAGSEATPQVILAVADQKMAAPPAVLAAAAPPAIRAAVAVSSVPAAPVQAAATAESALTALDRRDAALQEELRALSTAKAVAETELLNNLYSWLRVHQYPATGLMISYEGDSALDDWAFTYDQALMAQCSLLFGDQRASRKMLDFFATTAQRVDGGLTNAYDAVSGAVREYTVHAGPNLWIGIAALQYTHATGDRHFLPLAVSIASWVEQLQRQDPEGGIRGGPKEAWFSTEHNLDAYAFFTMMARLTGEHRYTADAERVLQWLQRNAHGRIAGQVNRGRGDATIATDTFAWSIAAIGPEGLLRIGFDPDTMLAFAEEHCGVTTTVVRSDKSRVTVDGFDFSKPSHLARGGIISTEWTDQMIVSIKMLEQYHRRAGHPDQAQAYHEKAAHYEEELAKLIISSPCPLGHKGWALPYASQGNVDTGHGWRTARGATTGSASGTIYHIFAHLGFNPLQLDGTPRRVVALSHETSSTTTP